MDEFGFINEKEKHRKKKGGGKIKFIMFIFFIISGLMIGMIAGFFLGVITLVNVISDLTNNITVIIDLNEQQIVDYTMEYFGEKYYIDNETIRLLEEVNKHPEQRDVSQTQQDFIPQELIAEIEAIEKQMGEVKLTK